MVGARVRIGKVCVSAYLLKLAGAHHYRDVRVESIQPHGPYRSSVLNHFHSHDPDTLLALKVNGEVLHPDHGYPVRLISPNNPGVLQTKWVKEVVVL